MHLFNKIKLLTMFLIVKSVQSRSVCILTCWLGWFNWRQF